jgi:type IX secretion system PorP/SprF family membrane protein
MKQLIKTFTLAIGLFLSLGLKAQQNIQFTQYIFNSLSVNPAYAGYKEDWYLQLAARSQWVGLEGAPQTFSLSIDGLTNPTQKRHGVGLQLTADKLGPQSTNSIYGNYAFRMRLDEADLKRLSIGIAAGVTQYSLNGALLDPINAGDPTLPLGKISNFLPDIRIGVYYNSPSFYIGASVMDVLSGNVNNDIFRWDNTTTDNIRRQPHIYLITGGLIDIDAGTKIRPSLLWKEDLRGPSSLDLNAMVIFGEKLWIGGGWRTGVTVWTKNYERYTGNTLSKQNSFSGILQVYANKNFRIGYSYDYIVSKLSSVQNGSHELSIGFTIGSSRSRVLSPRYF